MPFVFSYERFENALICIISRFRPILNFPIFRKNGASLELLNIVTVFENSLPKGSFGEIKKILIFWTAWRRILDSYRQRLLNMNRSHRFCFTSYHFFCFFYIPHFARAQLVRFCHVFGRKSNSSLFWVLLFGSLSFITWNPSTLQFHNKTKQQKHSCTLLVVLIIRIVIHSVHYLSSHSIKAFS